MDNQIAMLIALYEEEKIRLETLIKQCLEDFEGPNYLLADYHQRAYFHTNQTIRTLNRLEDEDYDNKQFYQRLIAKYEKDIETASSERMRLFLEPQILRFKEELNSIIRESQIESDTGILDNAMLDLISKRVKKFKIIFSKSENIFLQFSAKGNKIDIVSSSIKEGNMHNSELKLLVLMGFRSINRNRISFTLQNDENSLSKLKSLLIKIVFDISYYRHPKTENFIEF